MARSQNDAPPLPRCPWCGTNRGVYEHGEREYFCSRCKRLFDDDPAEGGDYSSRDPAARLEREERQAARRRTARRSARR